MDVLSDLRAAFSGAGCCRMVAWGSVRSDPWHRSIGHRGGTTSRLASAHGQRTAWTRGPKLTGTAWISCASLRRPDAIDDPVVARGLRRHAGSVLQVEIAL